jgi:uncharacterized membrane protein YhaH (DUF805 family)
MFCSKCGKENADDAKFCSSCGAAIGTVEEIKIVTPTVSTTSESMSFGTAIATCFSKFFNFSGRASRSEFWWFYLFTVLLGWASIVADSSEVLLMILNLAFFFPVIAAGSRRLHDTNRSGWWQLLMLTVIGLIPLIIWWASEGHKQENEYGKSV